MEVVHPADANDGDVIPVCPFCFSSKIAYHYSAQLWSCSDCYKLFKRSGLWQIGKNLAQGGLVDPGDKST